MLNDEGKSVCQAVSLQLLRRKLFASHEITLKIMLENRLIVCVLATTFTATPVSTDSRHLPIHVTAGLRFG